MSSDAKMMAMLCIDQLVCSPNGNAHHACVAVSKGEEKGMIWGAFVTAPPTASRAVLGGAVTNGAQKQLLRRSRFGPPL